MRSLPPRRGGARAVAHDLAPKRAIGTRPTIECQRAETIDASAPDGRLPAPNRLMLVDRLAQPGLEAPTQLDGARILQQITPIATGLLVVLLAMMATALFVAALKVLQLSRIRREQRRFNQRAQYLTRREELIAQSVGDVPGARVLSRMVERVDKEEVGSEELRGLAQQAIFDEERRASGLNPILHAIAATGPLLGLLGTVWGIIEAFLAMDQSKSSAIGVVAPAMAGALLTTALGLLAAIPSIIALQFADRRVTELTTELEAAAQTWIGILLRR
jgi:biopolymer transport protein TolQ